MEQEGNPTMTLKECTLTGGCTASQAKLTLDANWRWIHATSGYENCYTGDTWNSDYCSDPNQCAQNCVLEGVSSEKYENTYGIQQIQDGVKLKFVTNHEYGTNVGSRLYVMDNNDNYKLFYLKNREFSFEVDVSELQCGMNGAMYFCEMPGNGGKGIGNNNAGAKYGTGYCDAQCPHDIKFIDGEANVIDWRPNPNDLSNNMGIGKYGSCCAEMDIWEANSMATAYTPHTCSIEGLLKCEGIECGDNDKGERYDGVCDKDGCDINPYRMGNTDFYGRGSQYPVNTLKPMTVVTQFLTTDGTDTGDLSEIRRFYVQDGEIIESPSSTILGPNDTDSITDDFCDAKKDLFGDVKHFQELGGMKAMGESLDRGHVMIFSLWDDVEVNMLWLDSAYPLNKPVTDPGIKRGDCPGGVTSTPTYLRDTYPNGYVSFKNAAVGEIGSTLMPSNPTAPSPSAPSPTSPGGGGSCGCGPANGMSQPECVGRSEAQCQHMMNYEGKCSWTVCNPPTPAPVTPTFAPTKEPTKSPTVPEGCYSINFKDCLPAGYEDNDSSCNKIWLPNGAQNNCVALGGECTSNLASCCGPAECFGDTSYASCVPPSDTTSPPTKAPTTQSPTSPSCSICDDRETPYMINNGKDCTTTDLAKKCTNKSAWVSQKFCQLSCYNAGLGYDGDICCNATL